MNKKEAINELVNQIYQLQHGKKQLLIIRLVTMLVDNKIIEVRFASEFMLGNLTYVASSDISSSPYLWCKILECIQNFITQHDYKSCRDILRMLLEVVKKIPHDESSIPPQLESEVMISKLARRNKLAEDLNLLIDEHAVIFSPTFSSSVTDDIKLETLYEVI